MKVKNVYVVCMSVTLDPLLKPLVDVHKIRYNVAWQTNNGWIIARFVKSVLSKSSQLPEINCSLSPPTDVETSDRVQGQVSQKHEQLGTDKFTNRDLERNLLLPWFPHGNSQVTLCDRTGGCCSSACTVRLGDFGSGKGTLRFTKFWDCVAAL